MDEDYQNEDYHSGEYQIDIVSEKSSQTSEVCSELKDAGTESVTSDQGYENDEQEYEFILLPDMRMRRLPKEGVKTEPALFAYTVDEWRAADRKPFIIFSVLLLFSLLTVMAVLVLACIRCFLECPSAWQEFQDKCYYYNKEVKKKWDEAQSSCQQKGAHLMVIDHEKEQDFLIYKMNSEINSDVWIGLNYTKTENKWKWVDDTNLSYSSWSTEGGNPHSIHDKQENFCVIAKKDVKYKWKSIMCKKYHPFFCEKGKHISCVLQSPLLLH